MYEHIGCVNNWHVSPESCREQIKRHDKCIDAGHELKVSLIGNCLRLYRCHVCKISWEVDSSD